MTQFHGDTAKQARPVRVIIADDEALIRAGIHSILTTDAGIDVVAEATNGREAVDLVRKYRPDVALLDIRMPVMGGLAATREIRDAVPSTKGLILTTFSEDDYITEALDAGAMGFLLKASDPRELLNAIHAVAAGAAYLSPRIAHHVIGQLGAKTSTRQRAAQQLIEKLSERERAVLELITTGHSNAEVARRLHLVEGTVKGHMSSILTKTETRNRVQAAILAYEAGFSGQ